MTIMWQFILNQCIKAFIFSLFLSFILTQTLTLHRDSAQKVESEHVLPSGVQPRRACSGNFLHSALKTISYRNVWFDFHFDFNFDFNFLCNLLKIRLFQVLSCHISFSFDRVFLSLSLAFAKTRSTFFDFALSLDRTFCIHKDSVFVSIQHFSIKVRN